METIPKTKKEFFEWQDNFMKYVKANQTRMRIPQDVFSTLEEKQAVYVAAYEKAEAPNRGHLDVTDLNAAWSVYDHDLRVFIKGFMYSPYVTDHDRGECRITVGRAKGQSAPEPKTYPGHEVDTSVLRRLTIYFFDAITRKRGKPKGIHGAEIRWMISDTPITDVNDLIHSDFDTASPFTLTFSDADRGKTVYFCLRWENTHGEKGPWSDIAWAVVP